MENKELQTQKSQTTGVADQIGRINETLFRINLYNYHMYQMDDQVGLYGFEAKAKALSNLYLEIIGYLTDKENTNCETYDNSIDKFLSTQETRIIRRPDRDRKIHTLKFDNVKNLEKYMRKFEKYLRRLLAKYQITSIKKSTEIKNQA